MAPNNAYIRSRRREQECVNEHRAAGYISARSAGSKSPVDVWAFHPERRELKMIQIKTKKGGRDVVEKVKERYMGVAAEFVWRTHD